MSKKELEGKIPIDEIPAFKGLNIQWAFACGCKDKKDALKACEAFADGFRKIQEEYKKLHAYENEQDNKKY